MADAAESTGGPHTGGGDPHGGRPEGLAALTLGALGVVFGDIGTSPLYTLKECLHVAAPDGGMVDRTDLFGVLSLMFWALLLVVTVKYVFFVMRADHGGEGGILALLALVLTAAVCHDKKLTCVAR